MTNRQVFSNLDVSQWGYPDGLCMDADDHVWSARWQGGKVVRLKPNTGQVDVVIDFPGCWNMTCCVFGGEWDPFFPSFKPTSLPGIGIDPTTQAPT
jgi:sugar lactone lactonase YvrE